MRTRPGGGWRLLAVLVSLVLAACGGGGSAAPASQPAPAASGGPSGAASPSAASAAAPTREPVSMTVAYTPASGPQSPLWIAVEEGLFEKHGLKVTPEFVGGSSPIVQAMLSGQYHIALVAGGAPALNRLQGGDLLMIAAPGSVFSIDAWSKPEIRSIGELRGKTIAITRLGSATQFAALAMLASAGLSGDDALLLQSGGVGEALAALVSGNADAAMLAPPQNLEAKRAGFQQLAVLSELGEFGLFPELVVTVREGWLREPANRQVALQFLRAYAEGVALAKTDAAVTKRALSKYLKLDDEAILQATFEFYSTYFPASLQVPERSIANMLQSLDHPAARTADPKQFFDNSLVDEISPR